jgi:hypothetical protein
MLIEYAVSQSARIATTGSAAIGFGCDTRPSGLPGRSYPAHGGFKPLENMRTTFTQLEIKIRSTRFLFCGCGVCRSGAGGADRGSVEQSSDKSSNNELDVENQNPINQVPVLWV